MDEPFQVPHPHRHHHQVADPCFVFAMEIGILKQGGQGEEEKLGTITLARRRLNLQ
jgi:hypothetical protein